MKYDYQIVSAKQHGAGTDGISQTKMLNLAGESGWELVAVIPQSDGDVWFYLKGEKRFTPVSATFKAG
jgi:hypothetical protein